MEFEKDPKKLLVFNGHPENYLVRKTRFLSYLEEKGVTKEFDSLKGQARQKNKNSLSREITMHHDKTLQMIIALDPTDGEVVWNHLEVTYGKFKTSQILVISHERVFGIQSTTR